MSRTLYHKTGFRLWAQYGGGIILNKCRLMACVFWVWTKTCRGVQVYTLLALNQHSNFEVSFNVSFTNTYAAWEILPILPWHESLLTFGQIQKITKSSIVMCTSVSTNHRSNGRQLSRLWLAILILIFSDDFLRPLWEFLRSLYRHTTHVRYRQLFFHLVDAF